MTHVLVRNNKVVKTITPLRDLTTAESANGGTRYEVNSGLTVYIDGTVTITNGKVSAITDPNVISTADRRRTQVKQWLLRQEQAPISNWDIWDTENAAARADHTNRARNVWIWLEMIGKASAKDNNLTNSGRWAVIESEMEWTARKWYNDHVQATWTAFRPQMLATFYQTQSNGGGLPFRNIRMSASSSEYPGLAKYLES